MKYEIRQEPLCGVAHWMIYQNGIFFERWNTPRTASARLAELQLAEQGAKTCWFCRIVTKACEAIR